LEYDTAGAQRMGFKVYKKLKVEGKGRLRKKPGKEH
jgi:hypothetical protein